MDTIIPSPDPIGIPAPAWLLVGLLIFTFVLHLLAMNLLLGGVVVMAIALRRKQDPFFERLSRLIAKALPVTMSLTVTLGVAPLLFLQVLYGQAFYTSSILMAWPWLILVALVMLAYYGLYIVQFRPAWLGNNAGAVAWTSAIMILVVGFLFTQNSTLMLQPERWAGMYAASPAGLHLAGMGQKILARYFHFVAAAMAVAGLGVMLLGKSRATEDQEWSARAQAYGARWFLTATGLQFIIGFWYLFSLPRPVYKALIGGSMPDSLVLFAGIMVAVVAMAVVKRMLGLACVLTALSIALMAITRQRVREMMLQPHVDVYALTVNPQWPVFLMFAVLLVIGLAVVGWMTLQFMRAGKHGTNAAA